MVSESFLEHGAYLASGDLRLEVEQANRRRHRSDSGSGPKPSRSMSLFASWRPKHLHGEAKTAPMRFSELARKEEDDVSLSSVQSTEESQHRAGVTTADSDSSSGGKCEVKDSGVGLDEHPHSQESVADGVEGGDRGDAVGANSTQPAAEEGDGREGGGGQQVNGADSDKASGVCEDSHPCFQSSQLPERTDTPLAQSSPNSKSCNTTCAESASQNGASQSDSGMASQSDGGVASHSDSGVASQSDSGVASQSDGGVASQSDSGVASQSDGGVASQSDSGVASQSDSGVASQSDGGVASQSNTGVVSHSDSGVASHSDSGVKPPSSDSVDTAVSTISKEKGSSSAKTLPPSSLGEVGRTLSTPSAACPHPNGTSEGHSPVQRQSSLPDSQKHPPPQPRKSLQEKQTEYLMRRSQSLKRGSNDMMQKTNEAISGFWKLASKAASAAASASYSKFSELKQSITTPIKNAASISSLTRSQDELDRAGGSDRGSLGGYEEDRTSNSSTSGTIKERLRRNGSQDVLSTSESSYTESSGQRLSQTSFGENSLGKLRVMISVYNKLKKQRYCVLYSNNNNILDSSLWEVKAVIRAHNEEHNNSKSLNTRTYTLLDLHPCSLNLHTLIANPKFSGIIVRRKVTMMTVWVIMFSC